MDLVWFLLIGVLAGWLAGKLTKGRGFGWAGNLIVGVIGALLGGFLFGLFGLRAYALLGQLVTAVIGAVLLLYLIDRVNRRR